MIGLFVKAIETGQYGKVVQEDNKGFARVATVCPLKFEIMGRSVEDSYDPPEEWPWYCKRDVEIIAKRSSPEKPAKD